MWSNAVARSSSSTRDGRKRLSWQTNIISSGAAFLLALVHTLFEEKLVRLGAADGLVAGLDTVEAATRQFAPERVTDFCAIPAMVIRRIAREFAAAEAAACYGRLGTCVQEF